MTKKPLVGILDTKTSNIKSVYYALGLQNVDINYVSSYKDSKKIDAMIVPGIGNFSYVMEKLKENNLDKYILEKVHENIPSLFICVGLQILFTKSFEFGEHNGLNIFKGSVKKIHDCDKSGKKIRNVPLQIARYLGYLGAKYTWFSIFYILLARFGGFLIALELNHAFRFHWNIFQIVDLLFLTVRKNLHRIS